jgi:large subunit ribosomal protein L13
MSTEFPSKNGIVRQWHVIDAQNVVLGKLASKAAMLLMGKHKPSYTPFLDTGDHVIVINATKVRLTGRKEDNKVYRHFTGYPGGLVEKSFKRVRAEKPIRIVEDAIAGMLPKTKLGKQMYRKLNVYAGDRHPHAAQKPVVLAVKRKVLV